MLPIDEFIKAVYDERFVEAHEILEVSWKELKKEGKTEEANLQKGLINATTAIALKLREKDSGAYRVWDTYLKYKGLIDKVKSQLTPKYKKAKELLELKYEKYM